MLRETSATLTPLADGADLLLTGLHLEESAANVAEYYGIPLATLHYYPIRVNGQLLPTTLPSPVIRALMAVTNGIGIGAQPRRSRTHNAVNWAYRRQQAARRGGSQTVDRWKSRPTTNSAFPGWQPNGRNGAANGPLLAR